MTVGDFVWSVVVVDGGLVFVHSVVVDSTVGSFSVEVDGVLCGCFILVIRILVTGNLTVDVWFIMEIWEGSGS